MSSNLFMETEIKIELKSSSINDFFKYVRFCLVWAWHRKYFPLAKLILSGILQAACVRPVSPYLSMKQIDKVQIKFASGETPAAIKIARHNLPACHIFYTDLLPGYWTPGNKKGKSFHF